MIYNIFIFILSFVMLGVAAHWTVNSLTFLAQKFKWRDFVLVYFVLVIGAAIPNLSVGLFSVLQEAPDLFFGDVIGNSLITITLITGIAALVNKELKAESRLVQKSSIFVILTSLMPLLLIMDGELSRGDGVVLLALFLLYSGWLLSKRKLFTHTYEGDQMNNLDGSFLKSFTGIIIGIPLLILAGKWIVESSIFFAEYFDFSLAVFGLLIVAIGTSLPELFFIVTAAKKKNNWLALGGIIGDVIVLPTFGLGIIAIFSPIVIEKAAFATFLPLLIFLIIGTLLFSLFIKSGKKISREEAVLLLMVYGTFLVYELLSRII